MISSSSGNDPNHSIDKIKQFNNQLFDVTIGSFDGVEEMLKLVGALILSQLSNCYGDISYHTPMMDSSNLNIFAELSSFREDNFSFWICVCVFYC